MEFGHDDESKTNKLTAALSAILTSIHSSWGQAVMHPITKLSWLKKLTETAPGQYFYYVLATIYSLPEIVFRLIYTAAHNLVGDILILRQIVLLPLLLVGGVIMAITSPYRTVIKPLIEYDSRKPKDTILRKPKDTILSMKWPLIVLTTALVLAIVLLSIPTGLGPLAGVAAFLTTKLPRVLSASPEHLSNKHK